MKKYAFTILELLVVIAVIGLLTAILVPALLAAKKRARSIQCACNVRQLSFGLMAYQQDYEAFPYGFWDLNLPNPPFRPDGGYAGRATHDYQGLWWFNYLQHFTGLEPTGKRIKDPTVWCPARNFTGPASTENVLCGNYGANRSIFRDARQIAGGLFFGDPLRSGEVDTPALTFLISDSGYALISWLAAVDTTDPVFENVNRVDAFYIPGLELNQSRPELADQPDAIKGRHPHKTLNVGFADGHTEIRQAESLAIDSTAAANGNIPMLWKP